MVLQHFIFPDRSFSPEVASFMRLSRGIQYEVGERVVVFPRGGRVDFDTYFNAFSVGKWEKYTRMAEARFRLRLEGAFEVILRNAYRDGGKTVVANLCTIRCGKVLGPECGEPSAEAPTGCEDLMGGEVSLWQEAPLSPHEIEIPIPRGLRGICSVSLIAQEDGARFLGGEVVAEGVGEDDPKPSIAIDICTYRREAFVCRNMRMMCETVFAPDSPLRDSFEVFIADNGQSLELPDDCAGRLHVYPNKNAGGAGGFGRGMVEILKSPHYETFTHFLLMDDDIVFSYETLYRTWALAAALRPEYADAFLGGAMLSLDSPKTQMEAFECWYGMAHRPIKHKYDTTNLAFVIKNEIEDKGNYFGWWYCMMPIGTLKANNLPLPLFIKRDDIEYGIRNGRHFVTLNGMCVLHSDFGAKRRGFLEYYYWRNQCIINAIHWPSYTKHALKRQLRELLFFTLWRFRYNDANLAFVGVEDFLRGVDWFKRVDPERLNAWVMGYTYKALPVQELKGVTFTHGLYEKTMTRKFPKDQQRGRFAKVWELLRNWLRPAKGVGYVPMANPNRRLFVGMKTVINYDESSDTGFVTRKSIRCAINLVANYCRLAKLIDRRYDEAVRDYRFRFRELTSLLFWERYLGLDATAAAPAPVAEPEPSVIRDEKSVLAREDERKVCAKERKRFRLQRLARWLQLGLFMIPYRKNSVLFYLHARHGYTCNPKYILEELRRRFGDRVSIDWLTEWPEAVSGLGERGVTVLRLNTFRHWWRQFTARVIVTNDSFPVTARLRRGQLTINTWHAGMNYKHIGPAYCHFRNAVRARRFALANRPPKVYLSGSRFFTEDTAASFAYPVSVFRPTGMARNDIFFRDCSELGVAIRRRYAIAPDARLVLYAPTFRDGYAEDLFDLDFPRLRNALAERFGGEWKVLYRKHYFIHGKDCALDRDTINVSDYDDMNELLAVADVLISDYSSCLWDFALTKRPSFVYATDLRRYAESERDFAYPLAEWPYAITKDNDELESAILGFDETAYRAAVQAHLDKAGSYDTGTASAQAVSIIADFLGLKQA